MVTRIDLSAISVPITYRGGEEAYSRILSIMLDVAVMRGQEVIKIEFTQESLLDVIRLIKIGEANQ